MLARNNISYAGVYQQRTQICLTKRFRLCIHCDFTEKLRYEKLFC